MKGRIHDGLNILSKITPFKVFNAIKLVVSFYFSKWNSSSNIWGLPYSMSFEPTTACNLACPECPSGLKQFTRPTGKTDLSFFKKSMDELHKHLISLILYFQGEPYLHPDFIEMVKYASNKKIYTITSTNAHFIDDAMAKKTVESGLDRLIISIDGTTQEVYQNYRKNGNLETVIQNSTRLVEWKKRLKSSKPYLIFQFLVVRPNEHQLEDVKNLAKTIGVDEVKFKSAQIYDYKNGNPLIPTIEKYSRYKKLEDGTYRTRNKLNNYCWRMWHSNVVTWDGNVVPCCFDKDANHVMGDLKENSLVEIWNNENYNVFRKKLSKDRKHIDICKNCTEGAKVWL